ncbi:hypothetical protein F2Q70_00030755 [Brassica cretica]|uniref:Uncharacterized protein n=1 Tax=Brassica cretica TaxID=69181 RepID=A0A8S9FIK5_BRACR|nr:hypothetical protein F2Q70_00030755 [Brassica cretica]
MVKAKRVSARRIKARPYKFTSSSNRVVGRNVFAKKSPNVMEKNEWADAVCTVCMECPHNAVLLLCSSHDKGCRPYMCGTSFRHSNCFDQYKKTKANLKRSALLPTCAQRREVDPVVEMEWLRLEIEEDMRAMTGAYGSDSDEEVVRRLPRRRNLRPVNFFLDDLG